MIKTIAMNSKIIESPHRRTTRDASAQLILDLAAATQDPRLKRKKERNTKYVFKKKTKKKHFSLKERFFCNFFLVIIICCRPPGTWPASCKPTSPAVLANNQLSIDLN